MPKYYCKNGNIGRIFDAVDTEAAARKMLSHTLKTKQGCALLMYIGEKGFHQSDIKFISMIPFLKEANIDLPPDNVLIQEACKSMNIDPRILNEEAIDWLLYGGENNGFESY